MLKSLLSQFTKKTVACPHCGARSRVPVKPGKTLLVTCPKCSTRFEIKFGGLQDALQDFKKNPFKKGTNQSKFKHFLIALFILIMMRACFVQVPQDRASLQSPAPATQSEQETPILDL